VKPSNQHGHCGQDCGGYHYKPDDSAAAHFYELVDIATEEDKINGGCREVDEHKEKLNKPIL